MTRETPNPPPEPRHGRRGGGQGKGRQKYYGRVAKSGAAWSAFRQSGNELFGIPVSMVMARLLSPTDFGIAAAAMFFIQLAARLTQFGFTSALVRVKHMRDEHPPSVFLANLGMGVFAYLVLLATAPLIGQFFRNPDVGRVVPVAALTFLMSPFGSVSAALIQRRMQFRYSTTADWTDTLVGAVMTVTFALNGFGYWSIVYGNLIAVFVRTLVQMYLARWRPELRFSREALRELFPFGFGLQTKRLLEYGSSNLDNVVVGRVLGMASLGLYDKAFSTMNRLVTRLTLGQAPFRIFAIIHEDRERFQKAYAKLITSITLLAFPVLTGCIVAARPLFEVMYGKRWLAAVLPFQLLCAGGMFKLLNAYSAQANEAAGNIWPQVRRQAFGAALIVVGAGIGAYASGVTGAAFGVLAAMFVLTLLMQDLVKDVTGLSWAGLVAPQIPALTCSAALAVVLLGAEALLLLIVASPPALLQLAVQAAAGCLFYVGFVLFSPFAAVRDIVTETLNDMLPARAQRMLTWRPKPLSRSN